MAQPTSQSPLKPHPPPVDDFEAELRRRAKEVRGKYSRPVVTVNGTLQLHDTMTPVTKRPVTSGSLVSSRKGREPTPDLKKAASVCEEDIPKRHLRTRSLVYTYRRKRDEEEEQPHLQSEKVPVVAGEEKEAGEVEKGDNGEEKQVQAETADVGAEAVETETVQAPENQGEAAEGEDGKSTVSWITTKSQKKYIEELEQLLKTERMVTPTQKRIIAEEKLASAHLNAKA